MTAKLLMVYMQDAGTNGMTLEELLGGALVFPLPWPSIPPTGRVLERSARSQARLDPPYLARLVATLKPMESDETDWIGREGLERVE